MPAEETAAPQQAAHRAAFLLGETTVKNIALICMAMISLLPTLASADSRPELTIMTHDSFSASKDVLAEFEAQHGVRLRILQSGDSGVALNQAILAKNSPLADIFYGVDNTFLSRALEAGIFIPYEPAGLEDIPASLRLDPDSALVPVDFGDVCLNYDINWFASRSMTPPASLEDLLRKEYAGLTVVQNPATSSPGLAFLLATIGHFGTEGAWDFWRGLKQNGVLITGGWKDAYWGHFTAASKGNRPIVVSYATSPAAEVHFGQNLQSAPTAAVLTRGSAFRQIEFAGILKGTPREELARAFMDFVVSTRFQEDIPLQMFVFPANARAVLPEVFRQHARQAEAPAQVLPAVIDAQRDTWISTWTAIMLN